MLRARRSRESRMREIRTYGLMRERASLAEPSLLYFNFVGASANGDGTRTTIVVRGADDQFYGSTGARQQRHKWFRQPQPL
jgi:hypothetical protein